MVKALLALPLLLVAATGHASGVGPEIAYVKAGNVSEIYLVDPDGTRLRLLYRSKQRMRIFSLDMKPGGGELAFEEVPNSGTSNATLKVLRYDNAGSLLSTRTLSVCRIASLDYHPSGSDLLYRDSCSGDQRLDTDSMTTTPLAAPPGVNKVAWRNSSELVYNRSTISASEVLVAPMTSPTSTAVIGEVRLAESMDVSSSGNFLLVDPVDFGTLSLFNMVNGTEQKDWQIGHYGHFSPDDVYVAYATGFDVRGQYIMIRRTDGQGGPFRLAGKGVFGPLDWRN